MTDEQLARALHSAGALSAAQIQEAGRARRPGEALAKTILRLALLPPGEILSFAPDALDDLKSENPALLSPAEIGLGTQNGREVSGHFWVESGENDAFDPSQAPVVRWANELLKLAISIGASDIHLEPRPEGLLPRYRVDGQLRSGQELPSDLSAPIISRIKVLAHLDITETRLPQDGRFRSHFGEQTFDFRVSSLPSLHGEKLVLRLLDHSSLVTDLRTLGFSPEDKKRFEKMLARSHGMILITGPTGSGKTTTLYAALCATRDEAKNVITIEDPVEYELEGVSQCNVQSEIGLSFAAALRAALRQDPDVILVGEIRDEETADVAVRAALTGHLLLSTLHTHSAVATISRLQDMNVPPYLIASSLAGVVAQRLARLNCRFCRHEIAANDARREEWAQFFGWPREAPLFEGAGCERCNTTGKRGRVAILEMLDIGPRVRRAIAAQSDSTTLRDIAKAEGLHTLFDDAKEKTLAGLISPAEVIPLLAGHEE